MNQEDFTPYTCIMMDGSKFTVPHKKWQEAFELAYTTETWDAFSVLLKKQSQLVWERLNRDPLDLDDIECELGLDHNPVQLMRLEESISDLLGNGRGARILGEEERRPEEISQAEVAESLFYQHIRPALIGLALSESSGKKSKVVALDNTGGATIYSDQPPIHLKDASVILDEQNR